MRVTCGRCVHCSSKCVWGDPSYDTAQIYVCSKRLLQGKYEQGEYSSAERNTGRECPGFELDDTLLLAWIDDSDKPSYVEMIESLKASKTLGSSVRKFFAISSGTELSVSRGRAMIMLSDDDLPLFECDNDYKSYQFSNHLFADHLVPVTRLIGAPIIFWMSCKHAPGCTYLFDRYPIGHHVLRLGRQYSVASVLNALAHALLAEDVKIVSAIIFKIVSSDSAIEDICRETFLDAMNESERGKVKVVKANPELGGFK